MSDGDERNEDVHRPIIVRHYIAITPSLKLISGAPTDDQ